MEKNRKKKVRIYVQIFFFLLIALIAVNKTLAETGVGIPFLSTASIHAICPFGGVVTLYNLFTVGTFVQKIHSAAVVLMGVVFILTILFGPVFCGWICPLGSFQEWIGKIGHKIFKKKYNYFVPVKIDKVLRYFRYFVLVMTVFVIARSGQLLFENIDPYNALFKFWSEEVATPALVILGLTILFSLFVERPWCKYVCPYGALLGLTNKISIFKIKRSKSTCISCRKCDHACPMNIDVSNQEVIKDNQCIRCYECTSEASCPVVDTVNLEAGRNKNEN